MMGAGEALAASAAAAVGEATGLAVYDVPPVTASFPYAVVEAGSEVDWGHKSGAGRELRLSIILRDAGERPVRLRALIGQAEAALAATPAAEGWQVVSLAWLRSRAVREVRSPGQIEWTGLVEYRARMLATAAGG